MPIVPFIPAVIGVGVAVYSSSQQKKAATSTQQSADQAAAAQLADQQAARAQVTQLQQPFVSAGYGALDAIMKQYRLGSYGAAPATSTPAPANGPAKPPGGMTVNYGTPQGGATTIPGQAQAAGQPDWHGFLQANPDISEYYNQTPDAKASYPNIEDFAASIYEQQKDVRAAPPMTAPPPAAQGPAPYVPEYTRPDQPVWEGAGPAPNQADFLDPSKFTTSPGYEFRLGEGNRNLNAKYGARGLLKSGGAIKGFTDYNQGAASSEYGNWFNQQKSLYDTALSQYNNNRSADYNIFNTERNNTNDNFAADRSYGTNLGLTNRTYDTAQENTRIGNLFSLVNAGTSAAGATGTAAQTYANNAGNIYGSQAQSAADAAASRASANSQAVGAIGGIGANLFNSYAPRSAANSNTSGQVNLGSLNYSNIFGYRPAVGAF